jgi:hypothetical protein
VNLAGAERDRLGRRHVTSLCQRDAVRTGREEEGTGERRRPRGNAVDRHAGAGDRAAQGQAGERALQRLELGAHRADHVAVRLGVCALEEALEVLGGHRRATEALLGGAEVDLDLVALGERIPRLAEALARGGARRLADELVALAHQAPRRLAAVRRSARRGRQRERSEEHDR